MADTDAPVQQTHVEKEEQRRKPKRDTLGISTNGWYFLGGVGIASAGGFGVKLYEMMKKGKGK